MKSAPFDCWIISVYLDDPGVENIFLDWFGFSRNLITLSSWCTVTYILYIISCCYLVSIGVWNEVLKLFVTSSADRPGNISKNPDLVNLIQVDGTWLHISWEENVMMFLFSLISYMLFAFCFWGAFFLRVWFACWCTTLHSFYFYFPITRPLLLCRCKVYPLWMFLSCWHHIIGLWIWEFCPSNIWICDI